MTRRGGRWFLPLLLVLGVALFTALGIWQLERRTWKLELIERVNARVVASPIALPTRAQRLGANHKALEYLRVSVQGRFLHDRETLVDALTERGPGFWVLTPLRTADETVFVNRGFVPPQYADSFKRRKGLPTGVVSVTGLIRTSEPDGRILRPNTPGADRWYSRDVDAIASSRGIARAAPFFIDADSTPNPGGYPIGGMTVVRFRNAHLAYALTWFCLALLSAGGLVIVARISERRQ